ncbi:alpha/beta fold hydrolase [Psychrobacter sp. I-STPA10]|uniref:alpha/beta fold hydrolase n=1 Tax=Psychrobacter sp. I-STPA10 TaxID=2585769 RepID=UPI001E60CFC0|nr:alpha/beta hydrolase [Psychrobacter sp. I-STPA10]
MYLKNILLSSPHTNTGLPITIVGKGKPILLLHAFGMDSREFIPFIAPLSTRYQFYLPHFRGFGLASNIKLTQFDFIEQYADDTQAVISHICNEHRITSLPVAAISMGALVMWAYFQRFGTDKISRYLNIDQSPVIHNQPDWQGGLFGEQQGEIFANFQKILDTALPYLNNIDSFTHLPYKVKRQMLYMERQFSLLSVGRWQSKAIIHLLGYRTPQRLVFYKHPTWQHKLCCLSAYLKLPYDYRAAIDNIDIPVTLLIGARSKLYAPAWQSKLAGYLEDVNEIILPHSGHAIPLDAPVGFYQTLKQFLDKR